MAAIPIKASRVSIVNQGLEPSLCPVTMSVIQLRTVDAAEDVVNGGFQAMVKRAAVNVTLMFHPVSIPLAYNVADFNRQHQLV